MPTGTVGAIGKSKSGKPTVIIDGQTYSASQVDLGNLSAGDRIEFESNSSIYNGNKIWFLNAFKLVQAAPKYQPTTTQPATNGAAPVSGGIHDAERPCISNWGAELIKAGVIKDPADLGIWVTAMKNALRS